MMNLAKLPFELFFLSGATAMAFVPWARKEILKRDRYTCQAETCFGEYLEVGKLSWGDGWMIQAAHYPDLHQKTPDRNTENGRVLCTTDHIFEEMQRKNWGGASLLWLRQGIRNKIWLAENGYSGDEGLANSTMKMDFAWYIDFVEADEEGKAGLAKAYLDRFIK